MTEKILSLLYLDKINSPLGDIALSYDTDGILHSLDWVEEGRADYYSLDRYYKSTARQTKKAPRVITKALKCYFDGDISAIEEISIALPGTQFQHDVWQALRKIPPGTTCSYKDIAIGLNNPNAVRAVGMANNANPIAIVVPCHRVIGADGKMVGYGSGVPRKEWLLKHEGVLQEQGELLF